MLIAVKRWQVLDALRPKSDAYVTICIWPYNCFFTNRVDVLPLADPDTVWHELERRLAGIADLVSWEWTEQDREEAAQMCVWITEHENPVVP